MVNNQTISCGTIDRTKKTVLLSLEPLKEFCYAQNDTEGWIEFGLTI
jgi:hypothetical protein